MRNAEINPLSSVNIEQYTLKSMFPSYRRCVDEAKRHIDKALETTSKWYVACSFGKDSIVLLDLVRKVKPDVTVIFVDSGNDICLTSDDRAMMMLWCKENNINIVSVIWDKMAVYAPQKKYQPGQSVHDDMFKPVAAYLSSNPHDGVFLGLRKNESVKRLFSLGKHGALHQYATGWQKNMWRSCPLLNWKVDDVATYIVSNQLPILDIYKKMGFNARSGLFGLTEAQNGRVAYLRMNYPAIYGKFLELMPDIAQYA